MHAALPLLLVLLLAPAILCAQSAGFRLAKVSQNLELPTHIVHAGDGSGRLYVVEQRGRIRYVDSLDAVPLFLDISDRVGCCGERGLLGLAFPPGYTAKRWFYVYYTNRSGDIVISRFRLSGTGQGDQTTEEVILSIAHPLFANHNGGQIAFGPDGFLYIGTGDGGGAGDPLGNGQRTSSLLGKILRIDVEGGVSPYSVPAGNPFVSRAGYRPEIWALGLRNPWRFSFDRANGDLYIADVGQNNFEEVNWQPASSPGGQNYGWDLMEGAHCTSSGCNQAGLTLPVAEYSHASGDCSITGGFVYRGARLPELQGAYLDSDYCSGRLRALRRQGEQWLSTPLLTTGFAVSTFGEDEAGEIYLADHQGGNIYRLDSSAPVLTPAGIVNAASNEAGLSPGSLATAYGAGLSLPAGVVEASGFPLPGELSGVRVLVNGSPAPLHSVANTTGGEQVNFQIPFEAAPGEATVQVVSNGVSSPPVQVNIQAAHPGIFVANGVAAALRADYTPLTICETSCPAAHPGEVILLYVTGLGAVENQPATGAAAPDTPLSRTLSPPSVTVGDKPATVQFSGLAPRFAGLYQINLQLPLDTPAGTQELVVEVDGRRSKPAAIRIE